MKKGRNLSQLLDKFDSQILICCVRVGIWTRCWCRRRGKRLSPPRAWICSRPYIFEVVSIKKKKRIWLNCPDKWKVMDHQVALSVGYHNYTNSVKTASCSGPELWADRLTGWQTISMFEHHLQTSELRFVPTTTAFVLHAASVIKIWHSLNLKCSWITQFQVDICKWFFFFLEIWRSIFLNILSVSVSVSLAHVLTLTFLCLSVAWAWTHLCVTLSLI